MGIRFINNGKSGSSLPNIFCQLEEPTIKDGIWLQTNKQFEHIYGDDDIFFEGEWKPDGTCKLIPYNFSGGSVVTIGTDIYLLGGSEQPKYCYKYDTLTNTYARMSDIPFNFYYGSAVSVETNIYLFGGKGSYTDCYKYDTLANTYTRMSNIPFDFYYGSAVAIGTDIYLLGGNSQSKFTYKYDTLTDTYTKLNDIPFNFYNGSAVSVETNIYLFGGKGSYTNCYKYDTLANTYTRMSDIPYSFYYGSAVSVGTNIYLFGGGTSKETRTTIYKYDIITNTYIKLSAIPYSFTSGVGACAVLIDINIYLLGSSDDPTKIQVYSVESSSYENNSVVIAQGRYYQSGYGVELYNDDLFSAPMLYAFANAWFYTTEDGLITDIPTYYGNGTEWIKFKN